MLVIEFCCLKCLEHIIFFLVICCLRVFSELPNRFNDHSQSHWQRIWSVVCVSIAIEKCNLGLRSGAFVLIVLSRLDSILLLPSSVVNVKKIIISTLNIFLNKKLNYFDVLKGNFCLREETNYILFRFLWQGFNDTLSTIDFV